MAAAYLVGLLFVFGLVQAEPLPRENEPAFIEDLRMAGAARIVAGWEAKDGQIPHQISVRMVSNAGAVFSCGGSIIHHEWVITAAHCVANWAYIGAIFAYGGVVDRVASATFPKMWLREAMAEIRVILVNDCCRLTFVIRLGLTNLTRPEFIVETSRKFIHPEYDEIRAGVQTDDIALIGLEQSIPYGQFVQPCRLQNSAEKNKVYTGIVLTVSGYGMTDDLINGGAASEVLRWVHLRGISNEDCKQWYPSSNVVQDQTICAEYYNDTAQSSCQGDSGGPLTDLDLDGKPTMVGIVSFGSSVGCNSPFPSAYVRPGHYHDWFYEITGINFDWANEDIQPSYKPIQLPIADLKV